MSSDNNQQNFIEQTPYQQLHHCIKTLTLQQDNQSKLTLTYNEQSPQSMVFNLQLFCQGITVKKFRKQVQKDSSLLSSIQINYTLNQFVYLLEDKSAFKKKINENAVEINIENKVVFELQEASVDLRVIAENIGQLRKSIKKLERNLGKKGINDDRDNLFNNKSDDESIRSFDGFNFGTSCYEKYTGLNTIILYMKKPTKTNQLCQIKRILNKDHSIKSIEFTLTKYTSGFLRNFQKVLSPLSFVRNIRKEQITLHELNNILNDEIEIQMVYNEKVDRQELRIVSNYTGDVVKIGLEEIPVDAINRIKFEMEGLRVENFKKASVVSQNNVVTVRELQMFMQKQIQQIRSEIGQFRNEIKNSISRQFEKVEEQLLKNDEKLKNMIDEQKISNFKLIKVQSDESMKKCQNILEEVKKEVTQVETKLLQIVYEPSIQAKVREELLQKKWIQTQIDLASPNKSAFKLHCPNLFKLPEIQYVKQGQNLQLLTKMHAKDRSANITITKTSKKNIWLGIVDSLYINETSSIKNPNCIAYIAWNGKIKVGGRDIGQERVLEEGNTITMNIVDDRLFWKIGETVIGSAKYERLLDPNIQWVYFVTMYNRGDRIKIQ